MSAAYQQTIDMLYALPDQLSQRRQALGLTLRDAAAQIGVSGSTIFRLESGKACELPVAIAVLTWLGKTS